MVGFDFEDGGDEEGAVDHEDHHGGEAGVGDESTGDIAGLPLVDGNREPFDSRAALAKTPEVLKTERVIPPVPGLFDTLAGNSRALLVWKNRPQ